MDCVNQRKLIAIGFDLEKGQVWSGHFGMAPHYYLYDPSGFFVEKRENPYSHKGNHNKHHGDPKKIIELLPECSVFIAQQFGNQSKRKLIEDAGIQWATTNKKNIRVAIDAFISKRNTE